MTIEGKLSINKKLRGYKGQNQFLLSLKKSLSGKYCQRVQVGNKTYKVLSEKQYNSALMNREISGS